MTRALLPFVLMLAGCHHVFGVPFVDPPDGGADVGAGSDGSPSDGTNVDAAIDSGPSPFDATPDIISFSIQATSVCETGQVIGTLRLNADPFGPLTVTLTADPTYVLVSPMAVTFSSSGWASAHSITIEGVSPTATDVEIVVSAPSATTVMDAISVRPSSTCI